MSQSSPCMTVLTPRATDCSAQTQCRARNDPQPGTAMLTPKRDPILRQTHQAESVKASFAFLISLRLAIWFIHYIF